MLSQSFHKNCEIAKPRWQEKTQEKERPEMQDFTCSEKSPSLFGHCLDVGKLVLHVENAGINNARDRI